LDGKSGDANGQSSLLISSMIASTVIPRCSPKFS
jgi:hypothetical protein